MPFAVRAGLGCILVALVATCSIPFVGGPTPAQMLTRALTALRDSPSFKVSGSLTRLGVNYGLALSEDRKGDMSGFVTDGQFTIGVRRQDGKVLLSDTSFFQQVLQLRVGSLWVNGASDPVSDLVTALADRSAVVLALTALAGPTVSAAAGPQAGGARTTWLVGDGVSVLVGERDPTRPLSVITTPGRTFAAGLSDLVLRIDSYGAAVNRDVSSGVVSLADPNTLPVNVVAVAGTFEYESCDSSGCTLSQVVRNDGGRSGTATATFTVSRNGKQLGTCLTNVPALGNKETVKISCRVGYDRGPGLDAIGGLTVSNPLPQV